MIVVCHTLSPRQPLIYQFNHTISVCMKQDIFLLDEYVYFDGWQKSVSIFTLTDFRIACLYRNPTDY